MMASASARSSHALAKPRQWRIGDADERHRTALHDAVITQVEADPVGAEADVGGQRLQLVQHVEQPGLGRPRQGDDHLVDWRRLPELQQILDRSQHGEAVDVARHAILAVVEEAEQAHARIAASGQMPDESLSVLARADDNHGLRQLAESNAMLDRRRYARADSGDRTEGHGQPERQPARRKLAPRLGHNREGAERSRDAEEADQNICDLANRTRDAFRGVQSRTAECADADEGAGERDQAVARPESGGDAVSEALFKVKSQPADRQQQDAVDDAQGVEHHRHVRRSARRATKRGRIARIRALENRREGIG
jgi:hypothetical protein